MPDYLFLMHKDVPQSASETSGHDWGSYLGGLRASGVLEGGSAIGPGVCARKSGPAPPVSGHLSGYIRVTAGSLEQARSLLAGNPVFESGGTVEIRELPREE
jgi:hypothetical protein